MEHIPRVWDCPGAGRTRGVGAAGPVLSEDGDTAHLCSRAPGASPCLLPLRISREDAQGQHLWKQMA